MKEQRKLLRDSSVVLCHTYLQTAKHLLVSATTANKSTMLQVDYVNVGKDTYLIEVSESLRGSVPRNYEMQSTKKVTRHYFSCI